MFLSQTTFEELTPELLKKHKHRKVVLFASLFIGVALAVLGFFSFLSTDHEYDSAPIWEVAGTFISLVLGFAFYGLDLGCGIYYLGFLFKKTYALIGTITRFILALPIMGWIFVFMMKLIIPIYVVFFAAMFAGWFFALRDIISFFRKKPMIYQSDLRGSTDTSAT